MLLTFCRVVLGFRPELLAALKNSLRREEEQKAPAAEAKTRQQRQEKDGSVIDSFLGSNDKTPVGK